MFAGSNIIYGGGESTFDVAFIAFTMKEREKRVVRPILETILFLLPDTAP